MSIKLMSLAWEMDIPSTEKMVLLCLCDYADENGRSCYPAISTLAKRTSKNARTVQRALRWLENSGICNSRGRAGTSTDYTINLAAFAGGDKLSRVTKTTRGGGVVSPRGRRGVTQSTNEPPLKLDAKASKQNIEKPTAVEQNIWNDFLELRKAKRAPISNTALAAIEREADKAGWSLNDALAECAARGWQGFKADWVKETTNGKTTGTSYPDRRSSLARAIDEGLGFLG